MKKSVTREIIETILFVLIGVIIIRFFFVEIRWIPSGSMKPTLIEKDRVFVERLSRFYKTPARGDIMVFYPPFTELKYDPAHLFMRLTGIGCKDIAFIKRVVGLPGDKVEVRNNDDGSSDVYINDKLLFEPYIKSRYDYPQCSEEMLCGPFVLGEKEYFMMGDNRGNSQDSRYWGVLTQDKFIGRAKMLFWPLPRLEYFVIQKY